MPAKGLGIWKVRPSPQRDARMRRRAFDGDIVDQYASGGRLLFAGEEIEKRRLAGAVRADQTNDLVAAHDERNIVDRGDAAETFLQAFGEKNVARKAVLGAQRSPGIRHSSLRKAIHAVTRIPGRRDFDC